MMMNGREALSLNALKNANGGLIVDRGFWRYYWVVNERNGDIIDSFWFKEDAKKFANKFGVSKKVISEKEYKKRYNK